MAEEKNNYEKLMEVITGMNNTITNLNNEITELKAAQSQSHNTNPDNTPAKTDDEMFLDWLSNK